MWPGNRSPLTPMHACAHSGNAFRFLLYGCQPAQTCCATRTCAFLDLQRRCCHRSVVLALHRCLALAPRRRLLRRLALAPQRRLVLAPCWRLLRRRLALTPRRRLLRRLALAPHCRLALARLLELLRLLGCVAVSAMNRVLRPPPPKTVQYSVVSILCCNNCSVGWHYIADR